MGQKQNYANVGLDSGNRVKRQKRLGSKFTLHRTLLIGLAAFATFQACSNAPSAPHPEDAKIHFDPKNSFELLKAQVAFGPRYSGTEAHLKMRDWLVEQTKKYTDKVATQEFTHKWSRNGKTLKMYNVVAQMNFGAKKTVMLIAHWDTRPSADQESSDERRAMPIPGANDGASGVAVLLELMKSFKAAPPAVNVVFAFVDGEDLGPGLDEMFLGAKYLSKNLPEPRPSYGILLDMIGDADLRVPMEQNSIHYASDLIKRFYKHAQKNNNTRTFPMEVGPTILDDHICLNEAGLPTIDLIDFDYPYWHTLDDTVDKCSASSLWNIGATIESFLRAGG